MAYHIVWDNAEKTIIRQIFSHNVNIKDYYEANDEVVSLVNDQIHAVDLIVDLQTAKIDMTGFLSAIRSVDKKIPTNLRLIIVVQANQFLKTMVKIAGKFTKRATQNLYFVDTLDQAYLLIQEYSEEIS